MGQRDRWNPNPFAEGKVVDCLTFENRFQAAARQALRFARELVRQSLPDDVAFLVYPNQSYDDNPRVGDERPVAPVRRG